MRGERLLGEPAPLEAKRAGGDASQHGGDRALARRARGEILDADAAPRDLGVERAPAAPDRGVAGRREGAAAEAAREALPGDAIGADVEQGEGVLDREGDPAAGVDGGARGRDAAGEAGPRERAGEPEVEGDDGRGIDTEQLRRKRAAAQREGVGGGERAAEGGARQLPAGAQGEPQVERGPRRGEGERAGRGAGGADRGLAGEHEVGRGDGLRDGGERRERGEERGAGARDAHGEERAGRSARRAEGDLAPAGDVDTAHREGEVPVAEAREVGLDRGGGALDVQGRQEDGGSGRVAVDPGGVQRALGGEIEGDDGDGARGEAREDGEGVGGRDAAGDAAFVDAGSGVDGARDDHAGSGARDGEVGGDAPLAAGLQRDRDREAGRSRAQRAVGPARARRGGRFEVDGEDAAEQVERAAQRDEARRDRERAERRPGAELHDRAGDRDGGTLPEGDARALDAHEPPLEGDHPEHRTRAELRLQQALQPRRGAGGRVARRAMHRRPAGPRGRRGSGACPPERRGRPRCRPRTRSSCRAGWRRSRTCCRRRGSGSGRSGRSGG